MHSSSSIISFVSSRWGYAVPGALTTDSTKTDFLRKALSMYVLKPVGVLLSGGEYPHENYRSMVMPLDVYLSKIRAVLYDPVLTYLVLHLRDWGFLGNGKEVVIP